MRDAKTRPPKLGALALILLNKKFWGLHLLAVVAICLAGLLYMGDATYDEAPPIPQFANAAGEAVVTPAQIHRGERVFHLRGLMSYGSFWGDGAERGFVAKKPHRNQAMIIVFAEP